MPARPAPAAEANARDVQILRLTMAACAMPAELVITGISSFWRCDRPRDYFTAANGFEADAVQAHADGACPLAFDDPAGARLYAGRFTEDAPQILALYHAACEPGTPQGGGAALFDQDGQGYRLIGWYRGFVPSDCVLPPPDPGDTQRAFCLFTTTDQGVSRQSFGPVRFGTDGNFQMRDWIAAGNTDRVAPDLVDCAVAGAGLHDMRALAWQPADKQIVVEGATLDPKAFAAACARAARDDFTADERRMRAVHAPLLDKAGFLRPDERRYLKVLLRFDPSQATPQVEQTNEIVAPG